MEEPAPWRALLDESAGTITHLIAAAHRIAVIGIKPRHAGGPAYSVPAFLQARGFDVVPVPVYFPETTDILGIPVHRSLATISPPADMVMLFRRPIDVPRHVDEILAAQPRVVWMQLGIRHDAVAEQLARAGIAVIQDRCLEIEVHRRAG
jgi:hypothetical protein